MDMDDDQYTTDVYDCDSQAREVEQASTIAARIDSLEEEVGALNIVIADILTRMPAILIEGRMPSRSVVSRIECQIFRPTSHQTSARRRPNGHCGSPSMFTASEPSRIRTSASTSVIVSAEWRCTSIRYRIILNAPQTDTRITRVSYSDCSRRSPTEVALRISPISIAVCPTMPITQFRRLWTCGSVMT